MRRAVDRRSRLAIDGPFAVTIVDGPISGSSGAGIEGALVRIGW